ncbi:Sodium/hydrogen exchanger 9B2 [Podochytrium sp. JEL0797]|nr:Sodium/hydrogen exchanger 9B2 [Podochytrium sp. JEL0797]
MASARPTTLVSVLRDEIGPPYSLDAFRQYLSTVEYSVENLDFWEACVSYRRHFVEDHAPALPPLPCAFRPAATSEDNGPKIQNESPSTGTPNNRSQKSLLAVEPHSGNPSSLKQAYSFRSLLESEDSLASVEADLDFTGASSGTRVSNPKPLGAATPKSRASLASLATFSTWSLGSAHSANGGASKKKLITADQKRQALEHILIKFFTSGSTSEINVPSKMYETFARRVREENDVQKDVLKLLMEEVYLTMKNSSFPKFLKYVNASSFPSIPHTTLSARLPLAARDNNPPANEQAKLDTKQKKHPADPVEAGVGPHELAHIEALEPKGEVKHEHPHQQTDEHDHNAPQSFLKLLFSLVAVVSLGVAGGRVAEKLKQPAMLGMLLTGLLLRNLFRSIIVPLPHSWTTPLWTMALSAVTARAGLSLQTSIIKSNFYPVLLMGTIPVLLESFFLAGLVGLVFHMSTPWCFTLAFGVASVSPGVVVPLLLNLLDRPGWKTSRVPPLLLAATGLDVLIATSGFGIALAAIFGHAHELDHPTDPSLPAIEHTSWYTRAIEELLLGIGGGLLFGLLGAYLSPRKLAEPVSTTLIFVTSTCAMMVLKSFGFPGAASSCVIVCWAVIGNVWEKDHVDASNKRLKLLWNLAEPFLFPLIGASVCFVEIEPRILMLSLVCVLLSICVRMVLSFLTAQLAGLTVDEQVFTCGLWAGKASVQAALSTTTIELVHQYKLQGTEADKFSRIVFACMVSAIMLGGPFAASWVSVFGHKAEEGLLHHQDDHIEKD